MAAVEVTISGVLYDKVNRTSQNVVLIGEAFLTGLGVGGGPIIPPPVDTSPKPPEVWPKPPPSDAAPSHPIALPGDPWWPKPPTDPPINQPPEGKPPPPEGGWGWVPGWGWGYFPGGSGMQPHTGL